MRISIVLCMVLMLSGCSLAQLAGYLIPGKSGISASLVAGNTVETVGSKKMIEMETNKGQVAQDSIHNSTGTGYTINQNNIPLITWLAMGGLIMACVFLMALCVYFYLAMPPLWVIRIRQKKISYFKENHK